MDDEIIKPNRVLRGGCLGIIALSSPVEPGRFERGIEALMTEGFRVKVALDPTAEYGKTKYLFGSAEPEARARALSGLFRDAEVHGILAVRGAYGAMELLPYLDFDIMRAHPKAVIGFSDITCLLLAAYDRAGLVGIHGPSLDSCLAKLNESPDARESFQALVRLLGGTQTNPFQGLELEHLSGDAAGEEGRLIGGNLSLLSSLMGTPWEPDFDDHILCLEEAGEKPYRIHRMLLQLKLAGKLDRVRGAVFGHLTRCGHERGLGPAVREVIADIFKSYRFPVLFGAPFGHELLNLPVPLGVRARLGANSFEILEPAVYL